VFLCVARAACDDNAQSDLTGLAGTCSPGHVSVTAAYDADGADANAGSSLEFIDENGGGPGATIGGCWYATNTQQQREKTELVE
jgi:hypothetical protein